MRNCSLCGCFNLKKYFVFVYTKKVIYDIMK